MRFVPMQRWPRSPNREFRNGTFRASYPDTLKLLEDETWRIEGTDALIQTRHREGDIRRDGYPKSTARDPDYPGVMVTFESIHGPLSFACDTYWDWQDNLRAIALTLQNLRAVDRYGATKHGEQYKGWTAIPTEHNSDRPMSVREAQEFIGRYGSYKEAARTLHPDAGGSHEEFIDLQRAKATLEAEGLLR